MTTGTRGALARRHADWYGEMAREAEAQLTKPDQALWLDRMEADHDNLRVALRFRLAAARTSEEDTGGGLHAVRRAVAVLVHSRLPCVRRGVDAAGAGPARRAVRSLAPAPPTERGNLAYVRGDYAAAEAFTRKP